MTMDAAKKPKAQEKNLNNVLDALCQEFGGVSFYGLEYIVDELFQKKKTKARPSTRRPDDWLDMYD